MGIPRREGMKEVKDTLEAGFLFSDTICNYADIDTQRHRSPHSNYVTFQVKGNYNQAFFFLEDSGIASPRELRFITDFLRTACSLFFIVAIL